MKQQNQWPIPKVFILLEVEAEITKELKAKPNIVLSVMMLSMTDQFEQLWYRSNSWKKVLRITAYVLRFIGKGNIKANEPKKKSEARK